MVLLYYGVLQPSFHIQLVCNLKDLCESVGTMNPTCIFIYYVSIIYISLDAGKRCSWNNNGSKSAELVLGEQAED